MLYARENAVTHEHGIPGGVAGNSLCKQLQHSNMGMEQKHPHLTQRTGEGGSARTDTHLFAPWEPVPGQHCQAQGFAC